MTGYITIWQRTIPERQLWAIGGVAAVFVPIAQGPLVLLVALFPPLALLLLAGIAVFTWRIRAGADATRVREWAVATWAVIDALLHVSVVSVFYSPGGDLGEGVMAVALIVIGSVAIVVGSAAIAVGAYEVGRRRFWNGRSG